MTVNTHTIMKDPYNNTIQTSWNVQGALWPRIFEWYFGFFVVFNGI